MSIELVLAATGLMSAFWVTYAWVSSCSPCLVLLKMTRQLPQGDWRTGLAHRESHHSTRIMMYGAHLLIAPCDSSHAGPHQLGLLDVLS